MKKKITIESRVQKKCFDFWIKFSCITSAVIVIILILLTNFLPKQLFEKISPLLFFSTIGLIYILSYPYRFLKRIKERPLTVYFTSKRVLCGHKIYPFEIERDQIKTAQYLNHFYFPGLVLKGSKNLPKTSMLFRGWFWLFHRKERGSFFIPFVSKDKGLEIENFLSFNEDKPSD